METLLRVVALVLCLSVVPVIAFNKYSLYTHVITNWRADPNGAYETQTGVPFMIFCIVKCASNPACTTIDHFEDTCLFFTGTQLVVEDGTAAGHTLVYVRDLFVFNAANTFSQYTLTFSDAQQTCSSLGGRLANYTELETLFDRGFNFCGWAALILSQTTKCFGGLVRKLLQMTKFRCGFIDTGDMYMIMQVVHPTCGNMIGLHMCSDISTAAAWCYIYPL